MLVKELEEHAIVRVFKSTDVPALQIGYGLPLDLETESLVKELGLCYFSFLSSFRILDPVCVEGSKGEDTR